MAMSDRGQQAQSELQLRGTLSHFDSPRHALSVPRETPRLHPSTFVPN